MESRKIKLTVPELEEGFTALSKLDNPKMVYTLSYWVGRNMKGIKEETTAIAQVKQKLLQDHALILDGKMTEGDIPGSIKLNPEKTTEYWKQLAEINKQEIEINIWPISLDLLKDKDGNPLELLPSVFMSLDFLFTPEETKSESPKKK